MTEGTTYADLVEAHLADPGPETLGALRDAVRVAPGFDTELRVREQAQALLSEARYADADRQARLVRAALDSILRTGDGTAARPWSVLRISDEYDVVDSLGTRPTSQALVQDGARTLGRIDCEDGRTLHFDVTRAAGVPLRG